MSLTELLSGGGGTTPRAIKRLVRSMTLPPKHFTIVVNQEQNNTQSLTPRPKSLSTAKVAKRLTASQERKLPRGTSVGSKVGKTILMSTTIHQGIDSRITSSKREAEHSRKELNELLSSTEELEKACQEMSAEDRRHLLMATTINTNKLPISDREFRPAEMRKMCPHLEYLDLRNASYSDDDLKAFIPLATHLKYLFIKSATIQRLPPLPKGLVVLDCNFCKELDLLTALPSSLTTLACSFCSKLEILSDLPPQLTHLNCCACKKLNMIHKLPASLTHLDCSSCDKLTELPALPSSLQKLDYSWCKLFPCPEAPPHCQVISKQEQKKGLQI